MKKNIFVSLIAVLVFAPFCARADIASTGWVSTELAGKVNTADLKAVAFSGSYEDLTNKPDIAAAQVNADWNATSGVAQILNKPTIPTVTDTYSATSGDAMSGKAVASAIAGVISDDLGDLAYKDQIVNADVATNAAIDLSKTTLPSIPKVGSTLEGTTMDGVYGLTATVTEGVISGYKWELISR